MKKIGIIIGLVLLLGQLVQAQTTPTADQVIDKYITAIGGKDALMKVTDMTTNMSSDMNGNSIIITRKQKLPNKFSMVINANGMEIMKQTGDGEKVVRGGMQGTNTIEGPEAKQMMAMNTLFPELHYAENGVTSTFVGIEKVDGKDTYKLSHALADGKGVWTDNFDVETGLKVQSIATNKSPRGEMTTTSVYSDYKENIGIKLPMTITQTSPRGPMTMSVDNVKINKGIKDSDFTVK
ncbi:hypothetical protein GO730_12110 [Spirosoma sp. HMF3257]|uniref:Outer membrane lipoprotein-sorting protein n=1 Tax=Spirosoma telluris TaxID=2183553 RepID=A0A327NIY1_9BACT|nr:hypothetical protein [Spirosoma telluris]RAI74795.1 hypothetical protein HMF3257_12025 [Spirosoma telluris]